MKKVFVLLGIMAFVFTIVAPSFAATTVTTEKIITTTSTTNNVGSPNLVAQLKKLQATLAKTKAPKKRAALQKQINNLKARLKARMAAERALLRNQQAAISAPPPPPPMAPAPPPKPAPMATPAPTGLFGWGLKTDGVLGYISGNSVGFGRVDLVLGDMLGLGPMVGLSDKAVMWKIGLGYAQGNDINSNAKKCIPLFVDGVINLPANSYIGGGINYDIYGTEQKSGSVGGQVYAGIQGDLGLGGQSFAEVAYTIIRSGTGSVNQPYSMKGIGINVGQQILL